MKRASNRDLFGRRIEPPSLTDKNTKQYANLRTTKDIILLQGLLSYIQKFGTDYVVVSWISPPFGVVRGYGVYTREEAGHLAERSKKERWGFPRFGSIYDKDRLEEMVHSKPILF